MQPVIDLTKEYGIVLEGGGAKGAYQVGAWKALREAGVKIKGIAGTSVGALNGAMMCMGDVKRAEHVWESISYSKVMDVDDDTMKRLIKGKLSLPEAVKELMNFITEGGMDVTPLKKLIDECVDVEVLQNSPIEFYVRTFNVDEFKELDVDVKELDPDMVKDILLASAYIFPLFKNEKLHGKTYIDGGIIDNVPLESLIKREYKDILVIRIFGVGRDKPVKIPEDTTVLSVEPRVDLGNIIDFDPEKSKRNMVAGYYDTMRLLYGLNGFIYYIEDSHDEVYYLEQLARMYKGDGSLRRFLETEPLKLALELKLTDWDYRKLYLGMLEATAKLCRVPKYRIYTVEELLEAVWAQKGNLLEEKSTIPAFAELILSSEGGNVQL
ncbi:MAG: patatin-like phospholipase family protein [Blautia sp.]|jgi:NTE family protein